MSGVMRPGHARLARVAGHRIGRKYGFMAVYYYEYYSALPRVTVPWATASEALMIVKNFCQFLHFIFSHGEYLI